MALVRFRAMLLVLCFLYISGCGAKIRRYTAPGDSAGHCEIHLDDSLNLLEIDDVTFQGRQKGVGVRYDIVSVAPGSHRFSVVYFDSETQPDPPEIIELNTEPRKKYRFILDMSQGLSKKGVCVIAEDAATGEWLAESPPGIRKAYIVESGRSLDAKITVPEAPGLELPSASVDVVSEIRSSTGEVVYRIAPFDLRNIAPRTDAEQLLTFDAAEIAYRESPSPGGRITLKKVTEIRKESDGTYRAVGFIATAASELSLGGGIPTGSILRIVFGRLFASEPPK